MTDNPIIDFCRVKLNEAGEWYAIGYSDNHEPITWTEGYTSEAHAREVAAELGPIKDEAT
jgi:uncharacterized protein YegP (UPF0339 family)